MWWTPICRRVPSCGGSRRTVALPLLVLLLFQRPSMLQGVSMLMGKGCCPRRCCGLQPLQRLLRRLLHPASGIRVLVRHCWHRLLLRRLRRRLP